MIKNLEEINAILRLANAKQEQYSPPLWSRLYICLTEPKCWINRLALGRVFILMNEGDGGHEYNTVREYFRLSLETAWQSQFERCPWRKFKAWWERCNDRSATRRYRKFKMTDPEYYAWRRARAFKRIIERLRKHRHSVYATERARIGVERLGKLKGPRNWQRIYLEKYRDLI